MKRTHLGNNIKNFDTVCVSQDTLGECNQIYPRPCLLMIRSQLALTCDIDINQD